MELKTQNESSFDFIRPPSCIRPPTSALHPRSRRSSVFQPIKAGTPATVQITVVPQSCPPPSRAYANTCPSTMVVPDRAKSCVGDGDARSALGLGLWTLLRNNMKSNQIKPNQGGGKSQIPICVHPRSLTAPKRSEGGSAVKTMGAHSHHLRKTIVFSPLSPFPSVKNSVSVFIRVHPWLKTLTSTQLTFNPTKRDCRQ